MTRDIFADLNDALFTQMQKCQDAEKLDQDQRDAVIEQSKVVAELASNIIRNNNSKIHAMQFFEGLSGNVDSVIRQRDKMLGDGGNGE